MKHPKSRLRSWQTRAAIIGTTVTAVIIGTVGPAYATVPLTLSAATGPSGGGNTITATAATSVFTTAMTPAAEFQYVGTLAAASCSATYLGAAAIAPTTAPSSGAYVQTAGVIVVASADVKKLNGTSTNKLAITVPNTLKLAETSGGVLLQSTAKYNLCVYSGTTVASTGVAGSPLVANAAYTIAGKPTLASSNTVLPAKGPALGGNTISVTGTNFPSTGLTATLGGLALTNIVVASGGLSFTATVPAHAPQTGVSLIITSSGGTATKTAAYDYTNGVVISPNTATPGSTVDIDVAGVGFSAMDFSSTSTPGTVDSKAHVYLVAGAYDPSPASVATNKTNGGIGECGSVLMVSDTELICTLDLTNSLTATGALATPTAVPVVRGTYTLTVVSNGDLDIGAGGNNEDLTATISLITSGSTFTVSDY